MRASSRPDRTPRRAAASPAQPARATSTRPAHSAAARAMMRWQRAVLGAEVAPDRQVGGRYCGRVPCSADQQQRGTQCHGVRPAWHGRRRHIVLRPIVRARSLHPVVGAGRRGSPGALSPGRFSHRTQHAPYRSRCAKKRHCPLPVFRCPLRSAGYAVHCSLCVSAQHAADEQPTTGNGQRATDNRNQPTPRMGSTPRHANQHAQGDMRMARTVDHGELLLRRDSLPRHAAARVLRSLSLLDVPPHTRRRLHRPGSLCPRRSSKCWPAAIGWCAFARPSRARAVSVPRAAAGCSVTRRSTPS